MAYCGYVGGVDYINNCWENMKTKYIVSIVLIALCFALGGLWKGAVNENYRLRTNQRVLIEDARYYRTRDSLSAASVQQITLDFKEFKEYHGTLVKEAENLNLKIKRLESATRTVTNTVIEFVPFYRDSIVFRDGRVDTLRCVSYADAWTLFELCDDAGNIAITDTLIQFVHRVPRQWWFFKFGTAGIRQDVTTKSPHTEIIYTEYIKLKRNGL